MQDFMQFLRTRRTYRRFRQTPVPAGVVDDILEAARIASCGANRQTLKYLVVQSPEQVETVNGLVHWAAYLPPEQGTPKAEERPTLFIAVFQDEALPGANDTDAGLALGSMTAAAWSRGVGSCIMGAIDRPALCNLFGTASSLRLHSMVAFGYPCHESRVVEMHDGDVRYYLDDTRDYCVPKRPLSEILLGRI